MKMYYSMQYTTLHPVNKTQECSYFLFEDDKERIGKYYQIQF